MIAALQCPHCGEAPRVSVETRFRSDIAEVICLDCYDGAPDAGPQRRAIAMSGRVESAIQCWNDDVQDAIDAEVVV